MRDYEMLDKVSAICFIIVINTSGARAEQAVSDSGIIALTCVIGAFFIVTALATGCYCFRRRQYIDRIARRRKISDISRDLIENQADLDHNAMQTYSHVNGGPSSDKVKTFAEWKKSQQPSNLYTTTASRQYVTGGTNGGVVKQGYTTGGVVTQGYTTGGVVRQGYTTEGVVRQGGYTTGGVVTQGYTTEGVVRQGGYNTGGVVTQGYTTEGVVTGGRNTSYRIRKGSYSPPPSPRVYRQERGRATQRQYFVKNVPGSVAVRRTVLTRPKTRFHLDAELASAMFQKFLDKRQEAAVYILRSKSAPPTHTRYSYGAAHGPRVQTAGYTRNHYMSVKRPFGKKKFLLPPTLIYQEKPHYVKAGDQHKFIHKTVSVPEPQPVTVTRPPPPPMVTRSVTEERREERSAGGYDYHIKYEPGSSTSQVTRMSNGISGGNQRINTYSNGYSGGNQRISTYSNGISGGNQRTSTYSNGISGGNQRISTYSNGISGGNQNVSYSTSNYSTVGEQPHTTRYTTNTRSYGESYAPIQPMTVRRVDEDTFDLTNEKSNVYTIETTGAAINTGRQSARSYNWEGNDENTTYIKLERGGGGGGGGDGDNDTGEVFRQSITTTEVRASTKVENGDDQQYTIVDYVEPEQGSSGYGILSTSTPRYADQDVSTPVTPLKDLDNALDDHASTSSSSSSSSSSSNSS